jgi:hypothetical protein
MPVAVNHTKPLSDCFAAQRALVEAAHELSKRIGRRAEGEADLLRLGGTCVRIASERALAARSDREAIGGWRECDPGEKQIRFATYWAMRRGAIGARDYDALFGVAIRAAHARKDEIDRLRVRVQAEALV